MSTLLEMSISGAVIAAVIMAVRKVIQSRVSYRIIYGLWIILLVHLVFPFHISSELSIFNYIDVPTIQTVSETPAVNETPGITYEEATNESVLKQNAAVGNGSEAVVSENHVIPSASSDPSKLDQGNSLIIPDERTDEAVNSEATKETASKQVHQTGVVEVFQMIWIAVTAILGIALLLMQWMLSRKLNEATLCGDCKTVTDRAKERIHLKRDVQVFVSTHVNTPLVYGIVKPRIILPATFVSRCGAAEMEQVVTHELVHIKRFDYVLKPISLILLVMHWFNPILWLSYFLIQKDMEMSCDEIVVNSFSEDIRKEYATSLVNFAEDQNQIANTITLAFGENSVKSRIKGIMSTKSKVKWISGIVLVLLIPLTITLLTGRLDNDSEGELPPQNNVSEITDSSSEDEVEALEPNDELVEIEGLDEQLDILLEQVKLGNPQEAIQRDYEEAYQFIMDLDLEGMGLLKLRLKEAKGFPESSMDALLEHVKEKQCIEWLISDIIRNQAENVEYIRDEYSFTIISEEVGYGRMSPNLEGDVWLEIPKDTVVQITGFYDGDWMMAKLIEPASTNSVEASTGFLDTDQVEFWLHRDEYLRSIRYDNDIWQRFDKARVALTYASFFDYMVNVVEGETYYSSTVSVDRDISVPIYLRPDTESHAVGYVTDDNLITVKRDDDNQEIRKDGWVLIGQFEQGQDSASIGWIEEASIEPLTSESKPNQGFILRGTQAYESIDGISGPEFEEFYDALLRYSGIQPIYILNRQDGWIQFVDSGYTVSGWIRETDVVYQITDEVEEALYRPEYDLDLFVDTLKKEIVHSDDFGINVIDVDISIVLNDEMKAVVADSLSEIISYTEWEGGISSSREAAYPFYSLEFGDYRMVVTVDDRLFLLMDQGMQYAYGIGSEGPTVRWVEPNIEFIETIKSLLPPGPEYSDWDAINALFDADRINIYGMEGDLRAESQEQVHVNKCLRAVRSAMGDEIVIEDPEAGITDRYEFEFVFEGTADNESDAVRIVHTNRYILWNETYYEPLETPHNVQSGLFAGYF